ncbi:MAG: crossover junction endodeoxyribonuclease RuvC [Acidobacteria bacterium]|nr:crossover junction endodeoxyribonuclease RuvC [Acidobacteriota bacterium]
MSTILAIDPGARTGLACGWPGTVSLATLVLPKGDAARLECLADYLDKFPDVAAAAYETPFIGRLRSAARPLYHYESVILLWARRRGIPVTGYTPSEIKTSLGLGGRCCKDSVIRRVQAMGYDPQDEHQADAMALLLLAASGVAPAHTRIKDAASTAKKQQRALKLVAGGSR